MGKRQQLISIWLATAVIAVRSTNVVQLPSWLPFNLTALVGDPTALVGDPPSGEFLSVASSAPLPKSTVCSGWNEIPTNIPSETKVDALHLWANSTMIVIQNESESGAPIFQSVGGGPWTEIVRGENDEKPVSPFHINGGQLFYGLGDQGDVKVREGSNWATAEEKIFRTMLEGSHMLMMCSKNDFIAISGAVTDSTTYLQFSRDGGKSWFAVNTTSEKSDYYPTSQCSIDSTGKVIHLLSSMIFDTTGLNIRIIGLELSEIIQQLPIPAVLKSVDGGVTWQSDYFYSKKAGTLLTLTNAAFVGDKKGIYRTEKNWFSTFRVGADNGGLPESLTSNWTQLAGSDDVVFAGSPVEGAGMITSEDNGKTWKQADPPSEAAEISEYVVDAMHFDTSAKTLYAFWKIGTSWKLFSSVCNN